MCFFTSYKILELLYKMDALLPFELLSINNIQLRKNYEEKYYQTYYLKIIDDIEQVSVSENWSIRVLLDIQKTYLFIINNNDLIKIIATEDILIRNYIKNKKVWYGEYNNTKKIWIFDELKEVVYQCELCCDIYIKYSSNTLQCKKCKNSDNINHRVRTFNTSNRYLMLPINEKGKTHKIQIYVNKVLEHEFNINFDNAVEWWYSFDLGDEVYKNINIVVDEPSQLINMIYVENEISKNCNEFLRPQLRYSQKQGWINDPNGMVFFNNEYHLFYQHNPVGTQWDNMYWGHAISKDLIVWKELPLALYPNTMAEGLCFSGSANFNDSEMFLVFTDTSIGERIAKSKDGIKWDILSETPIIPKHIGRDPKILWITDQWILIVYTIYNDEDCFAFYNSKNLKDWEFSGYLSGFKECPEMIKLNVDNNSENTKWVIFGFDATYMIGDFDGKIFKPDHLEKYRMHYGLFQAAQCFSRAPKNIQIGWIPLNIEQHKFNQLFSLPLELNLKNTVCGIKLHAEPIKEIEKLREENISVKNILIKSNLEFQTNGKLFDIILDVKIEKANEIILKFNNNEISYIVEKNEIDGILIPNVESNLKLRIIIDVPVYDVCINSGILYNTKKRNDNGSNINKIELIVNGDEVYINEFTIHRMKSIYKLNQA